MTRSALPGRVDVEAVSRYSRCPCILMLTLIYVYLFKLFRTIIDLVKVNLLLTKLNCIKMIFNLKVRLLKKTTALLSKVISVKEYVHLLYLLLISTKLMYLILISTIP